MGYAVVARANELRGARSTVSDKHRTRLDIPNIKIAADPLASDLNISVRRDTVTITISRNEHGTAALCVTGAGYDPTVLHTRGEEFAQRIVQQCIYQRLLDEIRARGYVIVQNERDANQSIHLKVHHWEN